MGEFSFKIKHQDKTTKARVGEITTSHGIIHTPAFVPCGTQASVKSLTPDEIKAVGTQLFFVNTYHMMLRPGIEVIEKSGGLHKFMNWQGPIITDSGGFQVFSLGRKKFGKQAEKIASPDKHLIIKEDRDRNDKDIEPIIVKISDAGVKFQSHWDGKTYELTPEKSMQLQWQLGSDIHIAFDDCTSFPVTHEIAEKSMLRTHEWAVRSLNEHKLVRSRTKFAVHSNKNKNNSTTNYQLLTMNYQALYGVVQGSVFKDLREKSAEFISNMDFDGIAIGGVAVGESKTDMMNACDWVIPGLPEPKPRHLLGVGEIDDIFEIIERGVDTFDCVAPTRLARTGKIYQIPNTKYKIQNYLLDITKQQYSEDFKPLEESCLCYTCQNFSRSYIHHLFKVRELLAYRLATIHNLHFVLDLVTQIRENIATGNFLQFKKDYLK